MIEASQIKQIAGRAGRYRTAAQAEGPTDDQADGADPDVISPKLPAPSLGLVTTLEEADLPVVRKAMQHDADPIMSAGIFPPTSVLTKFATYFPPSTSFSYIMLRLHELSLLHPRFHLCVLKDQISIADIIQPITNMTTHDRIVFCAAPASAKTKGMHSIIAAFARCVEKNSSGALLEIPQLPLNILDEEIKPDRYYMERLESLHKALILYLWLSYRFAGVFINQAMAFYVKRLVEERIDKMLAEFSSSPAIRERIRKMRMEALRHISELNEPEAGPDEAEAQIETLDEHTVSDEASAQEDSDNAQTDIHDQHVDTTELVTEKHATMTTV